MLVELAVGDAYGAGFEYVDRQTVARDNDIMHYVKHPRHRVIVGHYTDDTQMSIAIAEAIVEDLPWTPAVLAEKFVAVFKRDPREGYSARFHELLRRVNSGAELLGTIEPSSEKSGAAMRAASIGVVPTLEEVIERATIQARITHDTPSGTNAAVAAALMAHYLLVSAGPQARAGCIPGGARPWRVGAAVAGHGQEQGLDERAGGSDGADRLRFDARATAHVCRLQWRCGYHRGHRARRRGVRAEIAQDLPATLVWQLEDGPYGRTYLADLDRRLLTRASRPA